LVDSSLCSLIFQHINQEIIHELGEMAQKTAFPLLPLAEIREEHRCNFHRSTHNRLGARKIADDCTVIGSI
jgi:hypothetical protein